MVMRISRGPYLSVLICALLTAELALTGFHTIRGDHPNGRALHCGGNIYQPRNFVVDAYMGDNEALLDRLCREATSVF